VVQLKGTELLEESQSAVSAAYCKKSRSHLKCVLSFHLFASRVDCFFRILGSAAANGVEVE